MSIEPDIKRLTAPDIRARSVRWSAVVACMAISFATANDAMSQDIRHSTHSGIPFDERISVRLRETVLDIPAGYFAPWPKLTSRGLLNSTKSIGFNFWMPTKRYVEIDDMSIASFHPREKGRAAPAEGQSIVRVSNLQLLTPDELGVRSPETGFRNLTGSNYAGYASREEFGLLRFWEGGRDPSLPPEAFLNYRHRDGSDPQILLRCTPPDRLYPLGRKVTGICDGYVYFAADQLSFYIMLSGEDLPRWSETVHAARDLFRSWRRREG
jgi:hypothetical protein